MGGCVESSSKVKEDEYGISAESAAMRRSLVIFARAVSVL